MPASVRRHSGDEDVRRPVGGERSGEREDCGERAGAQSGQPLVFAEPVLAGQCPGAEIGGTGDVDLAPRQAAILRAREPDVAAERGVARPIAAEVIPGDPDYAARVDSDRGLERVGADARRGDSFPALTTAVIRVTDR